MLDARKTQKPGAEKNISNGGLPMRPKKKKQRIEKTERQRNAI